MVEDRLWSGSHSHVKCSIPHGGETGAGAVSSRVPQFWHHTDSIFEIWSASQQSWCICMYYLKPNSKALVGASVPIQVERVCWNDLVSERIHHSIDINTEALQYDPIISWAVITREMDTAPHQPHLSSSRMKFTSGHTPPHCGPHLASSHHIHNSH